MRIARPTAAVQVPATTANLGPGYDALGVALDLTDEIAVDATTGATDVDVDGEGAETVPRGEDHLVVQALRRGLDHVGAPQIGVRLRARNRIPHGRGLGSSAAAVIGGLLLARGLIADPDALDDDTILQLATEIEGHPDNAAPALLGGAILSFDSGGRVATARLRLHPEALRPVVLLPTTSLSTAQARGLLPAQVPHADAAFTAARAALLVHALTADPRMLMDATEEKLHQQQRSPAMPASVDLMRVLRREGFPAVISGAGPSVIVLDADARALTPLVRRIVDRPDDWRIAALRVRMRASAPVVG